MSRGLRELAKVLPEFRPAVAVDVGANVGKTALEIMEAAQGAQVFAFEPVQKSYEQLAKAVRGLDSVVAEKLALGSTDGDVLMTSRGTSNSNHVLITDEPPRSSEIVQMTRGDAYFENRGIERIDYLKTNTNGWDLDVLVGFGMYIVGRRVKVLQVTTALIAGAGACALQDVMGFLAPVGYGIVGFVSPSRMQAEGDAGAAIATVDVLFALA
jgi:FkbM family methyltransferase